MADVGDADLVARQRRQLEGGRNGARRWPRHQAGAVLHHLGLVGSAAAPAARCAWPRRWAARSAPRARREASDPPTMVSSPSARHGDGNLTRILARGPLSETQTGGRLRRRPSSNRQAAPQTVRSPAVVQAGRRGSSARAMMPLRRHHHHLPFSRLMVSTRPRPGTIRPGTDLEQRAVAALDDGAAIVEVAQPPAFDHRRLRLLLRRRPSR